MFRSCKPEDKLYHLGSSYHPGMVDNHLKMHLPIYCCKFLLDIELDLQQYHSDSNDLEDKHSLYMKRYLCCCSSNLKDKANNQTTLTFLSLHCKFAMDKLLAFSTQDRNTLLDRHIKHCCIQGNRSQLCIQYIRFYSWLLC